MQTLWYLFRLFLCLALGAGIAKIAGKDSFHRPVEKILDGVLYVLLFFMGVNTGQVEGIQQELASMGLQALLATILTLAGSLLVSRLGSLFLAKYFSRLKQHKNIDISWNRLKTPLLLILIVSTGIMMSMLTEWFDWYDPFIVTILLYLLLFFVGMQMVFHRENLLPLLKSPLMVAVPLITVLGTYIGALAIPLVSSYTIKESMALASGFGWYSLSGILISDLGYPQLGAVSFMINLLREAFSFFLIPALAALGAKPHYAVSIAGATSMDVTLPLLKKSYSDEVVPLAIVHGSLITLLVPFLIPLWI